MKGANRIPAKPAKEQPSIQLSVLTSREFVPMSSVRLRSPTTARVCRPRWVERKKKGEPQPGGERHADDDRLVDSDAHAGEAVRAGREDCVHRTGGGPVDGDGEALERDQQSE